MAPLQPLHLIQTSWGRYSWEDKALSLPHASNCRAGAGTLSVLQNAPPVSRSPPFSSIFHSSCFLHKAGVSRDSSQMFSAAHHIAFLMKYSWSLSAFCHESLLQLPAMETLHRQHSCKAIPLGGPGPRFPISTFVPLLFPLPPPAISAGAGTSSALSLHRQGHIQSHVLGMLVSPHGHHPPQGRVREWLGGVVSGCTPQHGAWRCLTHPLPKPHQEGQRKRPSLPAWPWCCRRHPASPQH